MATRLDWNSDWPAPAKINLFLHVIGHRADGYHLLQTVFRFLDVGDRLRFAPRDDGAIVHSTPLPGVAPEQDLTVRAARALQTASKTRMGVSISIEKLLPQGGGLGGGSSDAATTLLALNRLWNCALSKQALMEIGLTLGADVPIFIHGRSAFAEGIGERFTDIRLPPAWYLLLTPACSVSTAEVFAAADLRRDSAPISPFAWRSGSFAKLSGNDLEAVTRRLYPEVGRHLDWLRGIVAARMTAMSGSGACCFAEFGSEVEARAALAQLPADMRGFVAQGLDLHPLLALT